MADTTLTAQLGAIDKWLSGLDEDQKERIIRRVMVAVSEHIGTPDTWLSHEVDDMENPQGFLIPSTADLGWAFTVDGVPMPSGHLLCVNPSHAGEYVSEIERHLSGSSEVKECFTYLMRSVVAAVAEVKYHDEERASARFIWPAEKNGESVFSFIPFFIYALVMTQDPEEEDEDTPTLVRLIEDMEATMAPTVPALSGIAVVNHVTPNSKVTYALKHKSVALFESGGQLLSVGKRRGQTTITLGLEVENPITKTSEELDTEDVAVIEAVTSLLCAGNNVISPFQIAETMGYGNPSTDLQKEIHERVCRIRGIVGHIDWTQQARAWKIVNPETGRPFEHAEISGNLLSLTIFEGTDDGGNQYVRYQVNAEPITYQHAKYVGQVVNYDQRLLSDLRPIDEDGRTARRVTRDQRQIAREILVYVGRLKNKRSNVPDRISYDALFEAAGCVPRSESARRRAIKFVQGYLRALQAEGEIAGFIPIVEQSQRHKQTMARVIVEEPRKRLK